MIPIKRPSVINYGAAEDILNGLIDADINAAFVAKHALTVQLVRSTKQLSEELRALIAALEGKE